MRKFRYVIIDHQGRERSGTVQGPNEADIRTAFRARLATVRNLWELTPTGELIPCHEQIPKDRTRGWIGLTALSSLVFLGLFAIWAWPSPTTTSRKPTLSQIRLTATGVLEGGLLSSDLAEIKLYGTMPELYLRQSGELDPSSGRFTLSFDFESRQKPRELVIEVERGEQRWEIDKRALDGSPEIDFGTVLVTAPPAEVHS